MRLFEKIAVAVQAHQVFHNTRLAPEPEGPRDGKIAAVDVTEDHAPAKGKLTMHVVGDSMVAGCGMDTTIDSLVPTLASEVSKYTGQDVEWSFNGKLGATMRRVRYKMIPAMTQTVDILFICAGSNDIMANRSMKEWHDDLEAAITEGREHAKNIVLTSSGQMYKNPRIKYPLSSAVKAQILKQSAVSKQVCEQFGVSFVDLTKAPMGADKPGFWASDKFHPGKSGYKTIAQLVVASLNRQGFFKHFK